MISCDTAALIHFYSSENVGDAAILAALHRLTGRDRLRPLAPGERAAAGAASLLISVGGDIFNNGRPGLVTRRFLQKLEQLRWAPERTILFGQSIPPSCDGTALRLLAFYLRGIASVTLRDPVSVERLAARGVRAQLSVDTVFALDAGDADRAAARRIYAEAGLSGEETALFSIRNFNRMYPVGEAAYLARITETMHGMQCAGMQAAVLLQANVNDDDTDLKLAEKLRADVPGLKVLNPFGGGGTPWRTALGLVAEAGAVIGTRYHTAIFRMVAGKMPVGLWYSNKGEDLHRRFGVPGASAGEFEPGAIVQAALDSANRAYDPAPLRAQVFADFRRAIGAPEAARHAA